MVAIDELPGGQLSVKSEGEGLAIRQHFAVQRVLRRTGALLLSRSRSWDQNRLGSISLPSRAAGLPQVEILSTLRGLRDLYPREPHSTREPRLRL